MATDVSHWAAMFARAAGAHLPADRPSELWPGITLDDAYPIQFETIDH
jgi:hypothetical protein